MRSWRDYLENILIAVLLALIVRTFIFTGYRVPTSSMSPTLFPGDFIFAYRLPYGIKVPFTDTKIAMSVPHRGDIVVFTYAEQAKVSYVKRVVGLPGDRIEIENGKLIVNGEKLLYKELSENQSQALLKDLSGSEFFKAVEEGAGEGARTLLFQKTQKNNHFGPLIVPPQEVFLLGDNRDSSDDSRYWGSVPISRVEGQVVFIWLSLDWQVRLWENRIPTVRWNRTGVAPR